MRKVLDVSLILFLAGMFSLIGAFILSIKKDVEVSKHKAEIEKEALVKYQKVFQMCEANMKTINNCNQQYGALIKLWEQVNKDCDQHEFDIKKMKEKITILNHNDKILEKHANRIERQIGSKQITVNLIDGAPGK